MGCAFTANTDSIVLPSEIYGELNPKIVAQSKDLFSGAFCNAYILCGWPYLSAVMGTYLVV